jgi:hypothetical protein
MSSWYVFDGSCCEMARDLVLWSGPRCRADDARVNEISSARLTRTECLALLGTTEFGHLTLTRRALPVVVPAHYVLDGDRVLIHASTGGNPDLWRDGEIVALHVDAFDADQRAGWSVSVTGAAREAANLVGAGNISHAPWLPAGGGNVIAVSTDLVWGQRFGPAREAIGDHERVDSTGRSPAM